MWLNGERQVSETADVVIIGLGVNGAAAAFHLARRGAGRIIALEQGPMAAGATGKSGALVRCHYANRPETELAFHSLHWFHNWAELVGGDCGFTATGALILTPQDKRAEFEANLRMQQDVGVDTREVSADEARALDPELQLDDVGGIAWEETSGYADPHRTTFAFAEAARRMGAELRLDTRVTEIVMEAGKVRGVRTDQGLIEAGQVLLAGGAWARQLLDPLGLTDLGLIPTATSVSVFRRPDGSADSHPVYIDHVTNSWLRPQPGSGTLIGTERGAVTDIRPDGYPQTPSQSYVDLCHDLLAHRMPRLRHATMRGGWTGLIMRSQDSHPVIDQVEEGLFLMSGDSGSSFKTAPAIGQCLSEWMLDDRPQLVDLTPFRASRFREGKPWHDDHSYSDTAQTISR